MYTIGWLRLYPKSILLNDRSHRHTVYPKKYAHGFVVLCFVLVMQSFIIIHQGCFAGTGAIVRLPQCQWSKPDGYGKISQCIATTKHSKAKTVCIFLGIYCTSYISRHSQNTLGVWPYKTCLSILVTILVQPIAMKSFVNAPLIIHSYWNVNVTTVSMVILRFISLITMPAYTSVLCTA